MISSTTGKVLWEALSKESMSDETDNSSGNGSEDGENRSEDALSREVDSDFSRARQNARRKKSRADKGEGQERVAEPGHIPSDMKGSSESEGSNAESSGSSDSDGE